MADKLQCPVTQNKFECLVDFGVLHKLCKQAKFDSNYLKYIATF